MLTTVHWGGIYDVGRHRIGIGVDSEVDVKI